MNEVRDQRLLEFLLGELGLWKRLGVRARLVVSRAARHRLAELDRATSVIAGAVGVGGSVALAANKRVRQRRFATVDALVSLAMIAAVAGSAAVWRAVQPPQSAYHGCPVDAQGRPLGEITTAKHKVQRVQTAR